VLRSTSVERRHRVRDDLEHARWQRCKRRGERCAATGLGICKYTPLACEHYDDEHLEPLHADATVKLPTVALLRSRVCAVGCAHACVSPSVRGAAHARSSHASKCA
jgi:hypothetical protein